MKSGVRNVFRSALGMFVFFFLVSCASFPTSAVQAQENGYEEQSGKYSKEELAQMLAPIALYPDALLAQVLMASTYPIEIIEADRWVRKNPGLKGETLDDALLEKDWAPSVKAVCHFPEVLGIMSERIGETTEIGNAFLAQEEDVMNMVQDLRARAHAEGHLQTTSNQKVIVQKETIVIEPANPAVIYVPYYDPCHVYGVWWYPAYPPYYWRPYGSYVSFGVSYWPAYYFSFSFGYWSRIDWHRRYIYIDAHKCPQFVKRDRWKHKSGRWHHYPEHRRGVAYRGKFKPDGYGYHRGSADEVRRGFQGSPEIGGRDRDRRYGNDQKGADQDRRDGNDRKGREVDRRYGAENHGRGREKSGKTERSEQDVRVRGGDRERGGMEKYLREKSGTGTVNIRDHGRSRVESDKGDGRNAYEGFGKVRTGRPSNIREEEGHERGSSREIRSEGVDRTGGDARSVGILKQQKREGFQPGRSDVENAFERFESGRRNGSYGDRGSTGTWNGKGGFQGGDERGRTATGRGNDIFRSGGDRTGGSRGDNRNGGDRGGESGGYYRGGGRSFGNGGFGNR